MAAGATYEPIATQTLASTATSITFSSIPATYTDLRLVIVGTASAAVNATLTYNSSATGYSQTYLFGNGTTAGSSLRTAQTYIRLTGNSATSTTIPVMWTVDIFSYTGSTFKTCLITVSQDLNGSGNTESMVGLWRNTSTISSLEIPLLSAATWSIGTTATLYGIKAA